MKDFAVLFFFEIARSSASASSSDFASGKFNSRSSRILFGTVASIRALRVSKPREPNISAASFSFGPICRREESGPDWRRSIFCFRECMIDGMERERAFKQVGAIDLNRAEAERRLWAVLW